MTQLVGPGTAEGPADADLLPLGESGAPAHGPHEHPEHEHPEHGHASATSPIGLPEPTRGPAWLDAEVDTERGDGTVRLTYSWSTRPGAQDPRILIFLDKGLHADAAGPEAHGEVGANGEGALIVAATDDARHTVRIELHTVINGAPDVQDRVFYLQRDEHGDLRTVAGVDWVVEGDAAVVSEGATATQIEDAPRVGDERAEDPGAEAHCFIDFDARIYTGTSTALPANIRHKPTPHVTAAIYDPQGNLLQRIETSSDGVARFRGVNQNPCNENLQLKTELRWYSGVEKIRMSPTDSNNYWQQSWGFADIDHGETWSFTHGTALSPQAYMLQQAREAYVDVAATGRSNMWTVYIHRTEGQPNEHGCSACALDDDMWFDGTSRSSESNDHTIYHEYGHNVHHWLAPTGRPGPAYGTHSGCNKPCHHWDSVHDTSGSALSEGWANLFAGMVTGAETRRFDLENPDNSRTDHPTLNCWGPNRECSFSASLWDVYEVSGRNMDHFLDVIDQNPQDIHHFEQLWDALGKPNGGNLDNFMAALHISANGDANSQGDAGNTFTTSIPDDAGWRYGVLSYDPHMSSADRNDYIHLNVASGERVKVTVDVPSGQDFDLYLYDNTNQLRDSSTLGGDATEDVSGQASAITAGEWRFRVLQRSSYQGMYTYTVQRGAFNDLDPPTVTSAPGSVGEGQDVQICWEVPGFGTISHTHVHWGTSSSLGSSTPVQSGEAPQDFCATFQAPASGSTIYYRVHAQGPDDSLFSPLATIAVQQQRVDSVNIVEAPDTAPPNGMFRVCWETTGNGPVDMTDLVVENQITLVTRTYDTSDQSLPGPGRTCQILNADLAGQMVIRARAEAGGSSRVSLPIVVDICPCV